jgi:hypothetical protein
LPKVHFLSPGSAETVGEGNMVVDAIGLNVHDASIRAVINPVTSLFIVLPREFHTGFARTNVGVSRAEQPTRTLDCRQTIDNYKHLLNVARVRRRLDAVLARTCEEATDKPA